MSQLVDYVASEELGVDQSMQGLGEDAKVEAAQVPGWLAPALATTESLAKIGTSYDIARQRIKRGLPTEDGGVVDYSGSVGSRSSGLPTWVWLLGAGALAFAAYKLLKKKAQ